jgi:hypothetical protein
VDVSLTGAYNSGIGGYKIYRNGVEIASISGTAYSSLGLSASTKYSYKIVAFDMARPANVSGDSVSVSATTLAQSAPVTIPVITPRPAKNPVNTNVTPVNVAPRPNQVYVPTENLYGTSTEVIFTTYSDSIWGQLWDFLLYIVHRLVNGVMKVVGEVKYILGEI